MADWDPDHHPPFQFDCLLHLIPIACLFLFFKPEDRLSSYRHHDYNTGINYKVTGTA